MVSQAEISGAFQWPTLIDYLLVAELQQLDLSLQLHVGALEVGRIGVSGGRVYYAELPGASGDAAIVLLARLRDARVVPELGVAREANVSRPWRELIGEGLQQGAEGRSQRLAQVRAQLRELDAERSSPAPDHERVCTSLDGEDAHARRIATDLLDWAAIEAYLRGEHERARTLLLCSEQLQQGELICVANLERLRLRLLEDEIASEMAEVSK